MTTLAASLTDFSATLKAENDRAAARAIDQSPLSPSEAQLAAEIAPQGDELWAMYRNALARARRAQEALRHVICTGVAPFTKREDGTYDPSAAIRNYNVCRLIDDYCAADHQLCRAAQTLCDCLELQEDGREEGVEWSLAMAPRTRG